ncbi:AI-2E family transporter [Rhodobacteraceae bacterium 2CG4]|uniref:AI-2E family transporter n=1 Tax=Halovulum marinum TaxID=2662447 RepID=A0A6L5YXL5_9RHOB|nr:AI-2E family transporter [Halovulum marinum]MSU88602.1 AI-2E family transporter [Halovulum marinum]
MKDPAAPRTTERRFIREMVTAIALIALALLLWKVRQALLIGFGGAIVATVILSLARPLRRRTGMPHLAAVALAALAIVAAISGALWAIWPSFSVQLGNLVEQLPQALEELEDRIGEVMPDNALPTGEMMQQAAAKLTEWSTALLAAVSALVLVVLAGVFLAVSPDRYRRGTVRLFPPAQQARVAHGLESAGAGLRAWVLGQLVAMLTIGTGVALGAWAIGLPAPLALGLIAGMLEFVPVIGPIAASVPALVLAATMGGSTFLWTVALYLGLQQVESNLLMPLIERSVANVPPAVFLLSLVAVGALFGIAGVILSAPLAVVGMILVDELYVKPLNGEDSTHGDG